MKSGLILCFALALAVSKPASAGEPEAGESRWTLHGFGTLGIARSNLDEPEFVRDLTQPDGLTRDWSGKIDSLVGIQANYQFNEAWEGVLQGISRYRYDASYRPELFWAFIGYTPNPGLGVRVGRLGTEFYMLADSRQVGYSNLTVRPPVDYFGSVVFSYIDGVDLYATLPLGDGLLRGKVFAGLSPERTAFIDDITWDMSGARLAGGHLDYLTGPWQFRLGHASVRFNKEAPFDQMAGFDIVAMEPELSMVDTRTQFDSLGAVYDSGPLQLQLMLSKTRHQNAAYEDVRSEYVIGSYRLGQLTPYLGYSRSRSTSPRFDTPPTEPLASYIRQLTSATHTNQHTWFLGARWDVRPNLAIKAQIDRIEGASDSVFLYRGDDVIANWDGHMTVYSLAVDFIF